MYQDFTELELWKKCRKFRLEIEKLTEGFPKKEDYRLTDQLIRSARSVTANIAEGNGRFHYQEYIQFCRISRGSLYEIKDHLICALDNQYLSEDQLIKFIRKQEECLKLLNGYISFLQKRKRKLA